MSGAGGALSYDGRGLARSEAGQRKPTDPTPKPGPRLLRRL